MTLNLFVRKITNRMHFVLYFVGVIPQGTATRLTTAAVIHPVYFSCNSGIGIVSLSVLQARDQHQPGALAVTSVLRQCWIQTNALLHFGSGSLLVSYMSVVMTVKIFVIRWCMSILQMWCGLEQGYEWHWQSIWSGSIQSIFSLLWHYATSPDIHQATRALDHPEPLVWPHEGINNKSNQNNPYQFKVCQAWWTRATIWASSLSPGRLSNHLGLTSPDQNVGPADLCKVPNHSISASNLPAT